MTEQSTFLPQGQGDHFDRWVGFLSAIVLDVATALTMLFAAVLFFAGVSGKCQGRVLDMAMPFLTSGVMLVGFVLILTSR